MRREFRHAANEEQRHDACNHAEYAVPALPVGLEDHAAIMRARMASVSNLNCDWARRRPQRRGDGRGSAGEKWWATLDSNQ